MVADPIRRVKVGQRPSASHMNRVVETANQFHRLTVSPPLEIIWTPSGPVISINNTPITVTEKWVKITGATAFGPASDYTWKYSWSGIHFTNAGYRKIESDNTSGSQNLFNDMEEINNLASSSDLPFGNGVFPADIASDETFNMDLVAITKGTPVLARKVVGTSDNVTFYRFSSPNGLTGGCV